MTLSPGSAGGPVPHFWGFGGLELEFGCSGLKAEQRKGPEQGFLGFGGVFGCSGLNAGQRKGPEQGFWGLEVEFGCSGFKAGLGKGLCAMGHRGEIRALIQTLHLVR